MTAAKHCVYRFTSILSFVIEGFNASLAHVRAGSCCAVLISRPPCESTLSLSRPIILEHYWLLMCLSAPPPPLPLPSLPMSNIITEQTNNPLFSYLVITASDTPLVILFGCKMWWCRPSGSDTKHGHRESCDSLTCPSFFLFLFFFFKRLT